MVVSKRAAKAAAKAAQAATPATQAAQAAQAALATGTLTHALVTGMAFSGTMALTTCNLAQGAPVAQGHCPGNVACAAAYQAIAAKYPGQTKANGGGFAKGTQAMYCFAAWYVAACGGMLQTSPRAKAGQKPYTNQVLWPNGNSNPGAPLATATGTPGRLTAHALWRLGKALASTQVTAAMAAATPQA